MGRGAAPAPARPVLQFPASGPARPAPPRFSSSFPLRPPLPAPVAPPRAPLVFVGFGLVRAGIYNPPRLYCCPNKPTRS